MNTNALQSGYSEPPLTSVFESLRAIQVIQASCNRAIAKAVVPSQQAKLSEAILQEYKDAGMAEAIDYGDYVLYFEKGQDDYGPLAVDILAIELHNKEMHYPPFADIRDEFLIPDLQDLTDKLREENV